MNYRKKLIEVALPLKAINEASAREKSIRHGHPSTLHLWWARRPLAACRAVLFASLVDDPDSDPEFRLLDEEVRGRKRANLFNLIEELVQWENSNNPEIIRSVRAEIARCVASRLVETDKLANDHILANGMTVGLFIASCHCCCLAGGVDAKGHARYRFETRSLPPAAVVDSFLAEHAPPVLDPFCGGGSIPLEAQRLGLRAYASDLNPVPVLITKALIEIPPKFAGRPPVNPDWQGKHESEKASRLWQGAQGLAEDVRYYGQWMRDEAEKRIGHLYPKVKITKAMAKDRPDLEEYVGRELTVIAWLWARTVASPNPACGGAHVPLVRSFWLSTKKGKETYVEPVIDRKKNSYRFVVGTSKPSEGFDPKKGTVVRTGAMCLLTGSPISFEHIRSEGKAARMSAKLMAIVAEGTRGRVYLSPIDEHGSIAESAEPKDYPETDLPKQALSMRVMLYGMDKHYKLFTARQLVALTTFSDLVQEARAKVLSDALGARASRPHAPMHDRGYLPHWEAGQHPQTVTFRLHDSLPASLLDQWRQELQHISESARENERRRRIDAALDAGYGACYLRQPEIAQLVENALLHFDGTRYCLHAWTIMPNHVHVLFTPLHDNSLSSILHSWKSFTAKEANKLLNRKGAFWQEEYFDRMIRDDEHFAAAHRYIDDNAVKAGLCRATEDWPFGSASRGEEKRAGRPRSQDDLSLADGGTGCAAYADAVATYLAFVVDKCTDYWSTIATWASTGAFIRGTFARQALPMTWDFCECNPFSESTANWSAALEWIVLTATALPSCQDGTVKQLDATASINVLVNPAISTDPPYYDNIGYADLSDFFYIWLRRSLKGVYPSLFATALTPKVQELIASPYRHDGNKRQAQEFFEIGLGKAFARMHEAHANDYPLTVYYAFKQSEFDEEEGDDDSPEVQQTASTGWESMLGGLIRAGFSIHGTWPIRTERSARSVGLGTNALASSIVLVCRPRPVNAPLATRKEFMNALRRELPDALKNLQHGNIAPVDLAQASIGPGMAVFTQYAKVIETDGSAMSVRTALGIINQVLDEVLAEQEGEFDADTRWALAWFEQFGTTEGAYGMAETLSKAKNTAIAGLVEAKIVKARGGKVQLIGRAELADDWNPAADKRLTVWETAQYLIRTLEQKGEMEAAALLNKLGGMAETARDLAYRLYSICERKKWADEALAYNGLVIAWPELTKLALSERTRQSSIQEELF
ncbi:MAG: REP-associated tyrosine transposase [Gemmataceae bacterium]